MFSVNVLLYGDYPNLAARCLQSIVNTADWPLIAELRIGLNAVSEATRRLAYGVAEALPITCHVYQERGGQNVGKYPLMRRMFKDKERPLAADQVMWFDDDSYITGDKTWWNKVHGLVGSDGGRVEGLFERVCMIGAKYTLRKGFRGSQFKGIAVQPWYNQQSIGVGYKPRFITGGWWVIAKDILDKWDYPFPELHHNGGDSILGELCRQQGYRTLHYNTGVAINYDDKRGGESKAPRRGMTTRWPWEDYKANVPVLCPQQCFDAVVQTFSRAAETPFFGKAPVLEDPTVIIGKKGQHMTLGPPPKLTKLPGF